MTPMKIMSHRAAAIGDSGLACEVLNGRRQYWYYSMPYGSHDEDDIGARNLKIATFGAEGVHDTDLAAAFDIDERHARRLRGTRRTCGWKVSPIPRKGAARRRSTRSGKPPPSVFSPKARAFGRPRRMPASTARRCADTFAKA